MAYVMICTRKQPVLNVVPVSPTVWRQQHAPISRARTATPGQHVRQFGVDLPGVGVTAASV